MPELLIKFPSRARPEVFFKTLGLYRSKLSGKRDVQFRCSFDSDDSTMNNPAIIARLREVPQLSYVFGHSKSKVAAINADLSGIEFRTLLLASDDMIPVADGYDDIICADMAAHFPGLDGVLHYNDGRRGRELNTLSIMGHKLYEQWGHIYHADYFSLWCDDEFQKVSERDGRAAYIDHTIIKHAWTDATGADDLHRRNERFFERDKAVFLVRQARGFPRESCLQHVSVPLPVAPLPPPKPPAVKPVYRPSPYAAASRSVMGQRQPPRRR